MKIRCQILITMCPCGGIAPPTLLWVTENNTIISEGLCLVCSAKITATVSLKKLNDTAKKLRGKPVPLKPMPKLPAISDHDWLHQLGIDDGEPPNVSEK